MFIKNCLTPYEELVVLSIDTTVNETLEIMNSKQLLSLPVADENKKFCGLLSKSNLFYLWEKGYYKGDWEGFAALPIKDAVQRGVPTLTLDDLFEDTLPIIVRFPFVPIVDENETLLGIVKRSRISESLQTAFGMNVPGTRILLGMVETEGQLDKIIDITHHLNIPVITSITFDAGDAYLRRVLLKIPQQSNKEKLLETFDNHGFRILSVHEDHS